MFNWIRRLIFRLKNGKGTWKMYVMTSKKDGTGRYRYHAYVDGAIAKEEFTLTNWVFIKDKK